MINEKFRNFIFAFHAAGNGKADEEVAENGTEKHFSGRNGKFISNKSCVIIGSTGSTCQYENYGENQASDKVSDVAYQPYFSNLCPGDFFVIGPKCHNKIVSGEKLCTDKNDQQNRNGKHNTAKQFSPGRICTLERIAYHVGENHGNHDKETGP